MVWLTRGRSSEKNQTVAAAVVVVADAQGRPQLNERQGQMRQEVGSMCAWLMRQGAARGRRNLHRSSSESVAVWGRFEQPGGSLVVLVWGKGERSMAFNTAWLLD